MMSGVVHWWGSPSADDWMSFHHVSIHPWICVTSHLASSAAIESAYCIRAVGSFRTGSHLSPGVGAGCARLYHQ